MKSALTFFDNLRCSEMQSTVLSNQLERDIAIRAPDRVYARLFRRLESVVRLSEDDRRLFSQIPVVIKSCDAGEDIVREGEEASQCCLILKGYVIRQKVTQDSRRQIMSFYIAGDIPDLQSLHLRPSDHTLSALGPAVIALVQHTALHSILARSTRLTHALWRETLVDSAIYREWLISLGGKDAIARVAHLLCELTMRLQVVELAPDLTFSLPWTQSDIADACGISQVHVNRVVQVLRTRGVIQWRSKSIKILRWNELRRIGEFSSDYLHLGTPFDACT
jgi:CRP-like cAMP-binding protein